MRRTTAALALAIAAVALPAAAALSGNVYTDPATTIGVAHGAEFLVALPSNPTTGYGWTVRVSGSGVVSEGSAYQGASAHGMMGAGGQQIFAFETTHAGSATLTFSYARPFEKGKPPVKTAVFRVSVT